MRGSSHSQMMRMDKVNSDSQMEAAGDPALALAQKAMREGKAGLVTDDKGNFAIVEK